MTPPSTNLLPETLPEVLCIGETMAMLTPEPGTAIADETQLTLSIGGAESNVAIALSHLGHSTRWWSRLGSDPFGQVIASVLESRGVEVAATMAATERTGVYFKNHREGRTQVYYYRHGSAASRMSRHDIAELTAPARLVHVSGITAALSHSCDDLLESVVNERRFSPALVSFDVNYRPRLWTASQAAGRLLELSRAADIVFIGRDEAELLWDTPDAESIRARLPDVPVLVVKDAEIGATAFRGDDTAFAASPAVEIIEPVGAGDAFAAGFLSGVLRGAPLESGLRLGHLLAAATLRTPGDIPYFPDRSLLLQQAGMLHADQSATSG